MDVEGRTTGPLDLDNNFLPVQSDQRADSWMVFPYALWDKNELGLGAWGMHLPLSVGVTATIWPGVSPSLFASEASNPAWSSTSPSWANFRACSLVSFWTGATFEPWTVLRYSLRRAIHFNLVKLREQGVRRYRRTATV